MTNESVRHTTSACVFCGMCENLNNVKVIHKIMEHISIASTMYTYNDVTKGNKLEVFKRLNGRIAIRVEDMR